MKFFKNKKFIISISSLMAIILVACLSYGIVASWLTKETLQSSVEISLLLQGDEADIYESPVNLTSKGTYELSEVGTKDTDGTYVGNNVEEGQKAEPTRENFYDYVMPGVNIPKDPKVFITKKSGAPAYLYIEVIEDKFPAYFTEEGFEELGVDDPEQNPNEVKPVYYDLEDYWTPVYADDGITHAVGVNGGKLYVYYNTDSYFDKYKYYVSDEKKATYLSSYIMKDESNGYVEKQQYYGTNEVKTVNGSPMDCPYFNILKNDTVYISEGYIHPEYYSTLYSTLTTETGTVTKEGHDFGLYFFSYMASAKVEGEYASPLEAYTKAGFKKEFEYLEYMYESTSENPENIPPERIVYVWEDYIYTKQEGKVDGKSLHEAIYDYFNGEQYKVVLMENLEIDRSIWIANGKSSLVFDMNGKTLTADPNGSFDEAFWRQEKLNLVNSVTIRGNGTIYFPSSDKLDKIIMFDQYGKLIIEDGNYIREYNPLKDSQNTFATGTLFARYNSKKTTSTVTIIKGGYFDNGYWDLEARFDGSKNLQLDYNYNNKKLLPVYDNVDGKGWLMFSDGSYLTIDPNGNVYKIEIDENGNYVYNQAEDAEGPYYYSFKDTKNKIYKDDVGYYRIINSEKIYLTQIDEENWTYDSNGTTVNVKKIYPKRVNLKIEETIKDTGVYVRSLDADGNWILDESGKYKLEAIDSYKIVESDNGYKLEAVNHHTGNLYGPDPKGITTAVSSGTAYRTDSSTGFTINSIYVFGGTFVGQNPAWGDELGLQQIYRESTLEILDDSKFNPQKYFNPYYLLYNTANDACFLYGQTIWQDESIPDEYNITESSTTYSYVDEATGKTKSFYVPVYTLNYSGEIPDGL